MATQEVEVDIRAGRVMCSRQDDYIRIEIEDPISGIQFAEIELPFEAYGKMLSGSSVRVSAELRGLEYIGKVREYVRAQVVISDDDYNAVIKGKKYDEQKEALAAWLKQTHSRDGWLMDTYLGSRQSIVSDYKTMMVTLNIGYFRYVAKQESGS